MRKRVPSLVVLVSFFFFGIASGQTKILDSNVDWNTNTLTVFLSDSGNVNSVEVSLGTALDSNNVYQHTWNVGAGATPSGDQLTSTLSGVTPGVYYLDLKVTLSDASVKEMQYQTLNP